MRARGFPPAGSGGAKLARRAARYRTRFEGRENAARESLTSVDRGLSGGLVNNRAERTSGQ